MAIELTRLIRALERIIEVVCGSLFVVLIVIVFTGIIDRAFLKSGISWIEELSRFLLTWVSLLAIPLSVSKNQHYIVDVFDPRRFDRRVRIFLELAATGAVVAASLPMVFAGYEVTKIFGLQRSAALHIPGTLLHGGVPTCFALCILFAVLGMFARLQQLDRSKL